MQLKDQLHSLIDGSLRLENCVTFKQRKGNVWVFYIEDILEPDEIDRILHWMKKELGPRFKKLTVNTTQIYDVENTLYPNPEITISLDIGD